MTDCLIPKNINWTVSKIANEQTIADRYEQIMDANLSEIKRKYCQLYVDDVDNYECCDSPYYSSYSR
jgi:hypothetical protein